MSELAINGGPPVRQEMVPLTRPSVGESELEAIEETFETRWIAGPGPFCERVEDKIESNWNTYRALTTTSCTHALEMALLNLNLSGTDEVIVPSFTYVSTALSVVRTGGTPRFADINEETLTITRETVEPLVNSNTRAIIMVHYGGFTGPVEEISTFCAENDIDLIEDAALAFDTGRNGRKAGTFGRFGAFSFHATKDITCGEGGLLLINREEDVHSSEMIRDKGTDRSRKLRGQTDRYTWRSTGSSYVLSDILGAVLWKQLNRYQEFRKKRRAVQNEIRQLISEVDERNVFTVLKPKSDIDENGIFTAFLVPDQEDREWMLEALQAEGIEAREHYQPLHSSPYATEELNVDIDLPVTDSLSGRIVRLPTYSDMEEEELTAIRKSLRKVYNFRYL